MDNELKANSGPLRAAQDLLPEEVVPDSSEVDLVGLYLREIGRYPLLSFQEEVALARRARQGDRRAREQLVLSNLRLVVYLAREYAQKAPLSLLDLIQEGNLGLLRAVEKYDPEKGFRFSTYAMWWIHHAIRRALALGGRVVRLPLSVIQLAQKIDEVEQQILDRQGVPPDEREVARRLGISLTRLRRVKAALQHAISIEDTHRDEANRQDIHEVLTDEAALSPEAEALRELWWEALQQELVRLSPRQYEVFCLRYGLTDGTAHTLAGVGQRLGISRERARQLEQQAVEKLRRSPTLQHLANLRKRL